MINKNLLLVWDLINYVYLLLNFTVVRLDFEKRNDVHIRKQKGEIQKKEHEKKGKEKGKNRESFFINNFYDFIVVKFFIYLIKFKKTYTNNKLYW